MREYNKNLIEIVGEEDNLSKESKIVNLLSLKQDFSPLEYVFLGVSAFITGTTFLTFTLTQISNENYKWAIANGAISTLSYLCSAYACFNGGYNAGTGKIKK